MTPQRRQIVREELMRSIVWFGLGIVGWPLAVSEVQWLDASVSTVFGLPVLTWALLTAGAIGVRIVTGRGLRARTPAGLSIAVLVGVMLGGVGAVYLVTEAGQPALWVTAAYVLVTAGTVLWYWLVRADGTGPGTTA